MEGSPVDALATSRRFGVGRALGRGGMGVVYEAFDRHWNLRVALKTLHELDGGTLLRLKNEFRAMQAVHHPNLVRLGELLEEDGQWLFTMELVDGVDFLRWVRPKGRLDEARLRSALGQLADALEALHAAGIVHRDVKPSNVLVTREGRVVLLDFGLVARVADADGLAGGLVIGTAEYMAPEQASGQSVTTAADWYSVGAMLYEALTGRVPFSGPPPVVLESKVRSDPPAPSTIAPVPEPLERLCMALLERDPQRRIGGRELARGLGRGASSSTGRAVEPPFVGRARELGELERAFADAARGNVTVFVHGESGIGKSALVRRFVRDLEQRGDVLVLDGHASDRELVPFNGFDGVVDALARQLSEPGKQDDALDLDGAAELASLFPVLSHVRGFDQPLPAGTSRPAQRARAFAALRTLLSRLAQRRRLVLLIDDFQWADEDTLALRRAIMSNPSSPGWLLVAVVRTTGESRSLMRRALDGEEHGDERHLTVEPLAEADALALVHQLTGASVRDAARLVRDARGHPLFLAQMVRAREQERGAATDLHATIRALVRTLSPEACRLMEIVAINGRPIRQSIAAPAAGLDAEMYMRAADEVRALGLTRTVGAGLFAAIAPYHDQIAEAILDQLDGEHRRELHRALAEALEWGAGGEEPRTLFLHWLAAGDRGRAARAAVQVAEEADRLLAFEQAAHYYRRAIELGGDPRTLLPMQAAALASTGKKRDAVAAYRAAAELERDDARIDHLRAAAEVLLANGDIDEGVELLRAILREIDMAWPRSQLAVLASLLVQRLRLRRRGRATVERPAWSIPRRQLVRIDVAWSVAVALSLVDRARAADFHTRGLLLALDAGEPYRLARAIILEAAFASVLEGRRDVHQGQQLLVEGRRLAERCGHPHALALVTAIEGIELATRGEFRRGAHQLAEALPLLRAHGSRWDVMSVEYLHLQYLSLIGDLAQLEVHERTLEAEASATQDLHTLANLRTGYPVLGRLVRDDVGGARAAVEDTLRRWTQQGFHRQHWFAVLALANLDLYQGRAEQAWQRVAAAWPKLRRSLLLRSQFVRVGALDLLGRAALASGRRHQAERAARKLEREPAAWSKGLAALLFASLDPSATAFEQAALRLDDAELRMHAAVARRRAGIDDRWWREQQVVNADGFVRCFAPIRGGTSPTRRS